MKTKSATMRVCWHTHQLQVFLEKTPPDSLKFWVFGHNLYN